jgi:flagellar basal-body rod modification protein FlgD
MSVISAASAANLASTGMTSSDAVSGTQQTLTQNDFLQLLVAQMQNQDPLNPQSDTEMAAQMAQFTSLQQSSAMSGSLAMLQANSLIGSTVSLQIDPQTSTSGEVQGVIMQNGAPEIIVNGLGYSLSQVTSVIPTVTTPASGETSNQSN